VVAEAWDVGVVAFSCADHQLAATGADLTAVDGDRHRIGIGLDDRLAVDCVGIGDSIVDHDGLITR